VCGEFFCVQEWLNLKFDTVLKAGSRCSSVAKKGEKYRVCSPARSKFKNAR